MRFGASFWGAVALTLSGGAASASEVAVGDKVATIVDSFARLEDTFGKPAIEVFLFSKPLAEDAKRKLAVLRAPTSTDFDKLAQGNAPVMKALLFFSDLKACREDTLVSATAVLKKSDAFPFAATTADPINWSFSRSRSEPLTEIGISRLACSFADGAEIALQFKNEWNVEKGRGGLAASILPAGATSLRFRWNIDVKTKLIVPANAAPTMDALTLETGVVKDVAALWLVKPHMLSLRLFKRLLGDAERKAAAGYPPTMPMDDFLGAVSIYYPDEPAAFASAKPTRAILTLVVKEGPAFRMLDYPIAETISVAGEPSLGATVTLGATGRAAGDPRVGQPPAEWRLKLGGAIQNTVR